MDRPVLLNNFSGGRTSAFMSQLLPKLPQFKGYRIINMFANTGLEREKTLKFAHRCDREFGMNLVWVEAVVHPEMGKGTTHKVVSFETASRKGEPFRDMCAKYGLPSKAYPHCTRELKLRPIHSYMRTVAEEYLTAIGIRVDELHRIPPVREKGFIYPLAEIFPVDKAFINSHWERMPFNLELQEIDGNCDLCWKKSERKKLTLLKRNPSLGDFWAEMEELYGEDPDRLIFNQREKLSIPQLRDKALTSNFTPWTPGQDQLRLFDPMDQEWEYICKSS